VFGRSGFLDTSLRGSPGNELAAVSAAISELRSTVPFGPGSTSDRGSGTTSTPPHPGHFTRRPASSGFARSFFPQRQVTWIVMVITFRVSLQIVQRMGEAVP
jgi:hypothetical protein